MENQVFFIFLLTLAALGLSQLCSWTARWLCRSSSLEGSFLILVIQDHDESIEARLTQACSEVCLCQSLRGVKVLLLYQGNKPETTLICRHLCGSRSIPYLSNLDDLNQALHS